MYFTCCSRGVYSSAAAQCAIKPSTVYTVVLFCHNHSLFRQNRCSTLFFSMEVVESGKIVHCWFQRCISLIKTVQLETHCLQSCDCLLQIFSCKYQREPSKLCRHWDSSGIYLWKQQLWQHSLLRRFSLILLRSSLQKKRVENWFWRKSKFLWRKKLIHVLGQWISQLKTVCWIFLPQRQWQLVIEILDSDS